MKPNVVPVSKVDLDDMSDIFEYILLNEDDNFYEELYNMYEENIEWTSMSEEEIIAWLKEHGEEKNFHHIYLTAYKLNKKYKFYGSDEDE